MSNSKIERDEQLKRADIYLKSAIRIFKNKHNFCCCALSAENDGIWPHHKYFKEFFLLKPRKKCTDSDTWFGKVYTENQNERILALLFAHAIALNP